MRTQSSKLRSRWWYLVPIFAGVIGGVIAWFALKNDDRKLAKNCLILGIALDVVELLIIVGLLSSYENFNLITNFDSLLETKDFDFQFQIESP